MNLNFFYGTWDSCLLNGGTARTSKTPSKIASRSYTLLLLVCIIVLGSKSGMAQDITRTWYLDNVRFDSGAVASGSFDYNTNPYAPLAGQYGTFSNIKIDITSPNGTVRQVRRVNPGSRGNECYISMVAADPAESDLTGAPFMALTLPGVPVDPQPGDTGPFTANPNCMINEGGVRDVLPGPANLSYIGVCRQANCGPADPPYEEALAGGRLIAGPQVWRLDNIVFDSGAVATGSFVYDEEPFAPLAGLYGNYSNIGIDVTSPNGTVRKFRRVNPGSRGNECYISMVAADPAESDLTGAPFMALTLPGVPVDPQPGDTGPFTANPNCMINEGGVRDVLPGPASLSYIGVCRQANCGPADAPYEEALAGGRLISNPGPQRWYLEGIRFDSGAVASGYFDYDEYPYNQSAGQYGRYSNINIDVTSPNGTVREFRIVHPASSGNEAYISVVAATGGDLTGVPFLALSLPGFPVLPNTPDPNNPGQQLIPSVAPSPLALNNLGGVREVLPGPQNLSYVGVCRQFNCGPADPPYEEAMSGGRLVTEVAAPVIVSNSAVTVVENQTTVIDIESTDNLDTESDGLVYSKTGGADQARFNLDVNSGVVTFVSAPDYDNPADAGANNSYELQVTVTDLGGRTAVQDLVVTVVKLQTWQLSGVQLSDGKTLTGTFDFVAALNEYSNVSITLNDGTGTTYNVNNPGVTSDSATLSLLNQVLSNLTGGSTLRFTFANALTDSGGTVDILTNVPVAGTVSALATCLNTDCSTYTTPLLPMSGRVTTLIDVTAPTASPTFAPMVNTAGWYNADVTVSWNWTDGAGGSGVDPNNCPSTFTFTGEGPQATVGQCFDLAGNLGLLGSGSVNIDKTAPETNITANPSVTSMSRDASFEFSGSDSGSGIAGFECQLDGVGFSNCESPINFGGIIDGNHIFLVRSVDLAGNVDQTPASFSWSVQVNTAPTITSSASASVPENQTAAIDVQTSDDSDSEGSGLTYNKTGGADQGQFNLDASTGVLTFVSEPDFEVPADANTDNNYEVQVTVTDSGDLMDVQDIVISVTNVEENTAPTITSSASASVPENQTAAIDVQTSDDSDSEGSGLTYNKTGGADQGQFNLDASTGVLTFVSEPDFEVPADANTDNNYEVQVTVTDSGDLMDVQDIVISVTNVEENTAPTITSSASASVPENQTAAIDVQTSDDSDSEGSGLTYNKTGGADQGQFNLDASTGVLTFVSEPDFEVPADANTDNNYEVQVTVTDSGDLMDVQDIVISVTNEQDGTNTNLTTNISGSGFLTINGTDVDDNIVVTGTGPGSIEVSDGANDGAPVGSFDGVTGLRINGKNGINHVSLVLVDIPNTLALNGGGADDKLIIANSLTVGGSLSIDLGGGNNMIMMATTDVVIDVGSNASIETSSDQDMVDIPNITTGNHFDIDVGGGNDSVKLGVQGGTVMIGNRLTIRSGSGDNDVILIDNQVINAVQLFSGSGMDDYDISGTIVGSFMDVLSGGGNDGVMSEMNTITGEYNVNCGPGTDSLVSTNDQGNPLKQRRCEVVP